MVTVYADVLVGINILITYILIVCTRVFCRAPTNKWGVALSSLFGGVSSLMIFFDSLNNGLWVLIKLAIAAIIVGVAFLPGKFRLFIKTFVSFFGISFLFGGIMYAVEITFEPQNILYINGTVYFDMSLKYLTGSVLVIYGLFLLCNYFLSRYFVHKEIYDVEITFRGTTVKTKGFADTGNNLKDGITGRPVIVAELSCVSPLFTDDEVEYFKTRSYESIPESLKTKVRIIPCSTVAGEGMLKGFISEKTELRFGNEVAVSENQVVAISVKPLSSGEYQVLLDNSISNLNWRAKNNEKVFE